MNKHYIRLDGTNVIKGFSDAFEQPLETDICINEDGGRHYNPSLFHEDGCPKYKYTEKMKELTITEKAAWRNINIPPIENPNLTLEERIDRLEIIALEEAGVI